MAPYNDIYNVSFNDSDMASTLLPVVIVISCYMIIGLFGNLLAVYYYGCHVKPSSSYNFIVSMAIFDIIICCVSMPLDRRYMYSYFQNAIACKSLRFVNYFASNSSGFVLIAITADRYRKVCQPFTRQITAKMTKLIIVTVCLISLSISLPSFLFYDIYAVNITAVPGFDAYDCTTIRKEEYQLYIPVMIYTGVCFLIFIGSISSLLVLYILIGRKLFQLKRFRFSAMSQQSETVSHSPPTSSTDIDNNSKRNKEFQHHVTKCTFSAHTSNKLNNAVLHPNRTELPIPCRQTGTRRSQALNEETQQYCR